MSSTLRENLSTINMPSNYRFSDQVQARVMASRTSTQVYSEGLDADTYCI
jgi:hypothetical protein